MRVECETRVYNPAQRSMVYVSVLFCIVFLKGEKCRNYC